MSDATLVVAELQDLTSTVEAVAKAIRDRPEQVVNVAVPEGPAPVVNVAVPEGPAPVVNVAVPQAAAPDVVVNVAQAPAADVVVNVPRTLPNAYRVRITERDDAGYIVSFVIEPQERIPA
jgi:hypothetical protein